MPGVDHVAVEVPSDGNAATLDSHATTTFNTMIMLQEDDGDGLQCRKEIAAAIGKYFSLPARFPYTDYQTNM